VVSTIHVKHLLDMAPSEMWPESFRYGVETFDVGIPAFVVYLATTAAPFPAVSSGLAGWPEDLVRACREMRDGHFVAETPWLLAATPTLVDPGRAPAGHHTVKLITPQGSSAPPGFASWPDARDWYAAELGPPRARPHRRRDPRVARPQPAGHRGRQPAHDRRHVPRRRPRDPVQRRVAPRAGLGATLGCRSPASIQTGGTTHPGGSITGGPGATRRSSCSRTWEPASRRCFRVPDARVQAAIDHWAPRFVQAGVDYNDFVRTTAKIERWEEWLGAWCDLGDEHAEQAREAEVGGRHRTAGEAWLRAAVAYHFGKFVWVLDADRARAGRRSRRRPRWRRATGSCAPAWSGSRRPWRSATFVFPPPTPRH
jgi:hypothetical protein